MMYRIGVVGPSWSLERILGIAKEFEQGMEFVAFPYEEPEETKKIVKDYDKKIHAWLFSGELPYEIARKVLGSNENLLYIPHTESSLYKSFLNIRAGLSSSKGFQSSKSLKERRKDQRQSIQTA